MIEGLKIRMLGKTDDITSLALLWMEEDMEKSGSTSELSEIVYFLNRRRDRGSDFWLANFNLSSIGYAMGRNHNDLYTSQGVYVKPNFRRRGIASELKRAQIDFARTLGCSKVETEIWGNNPASVALQKKFGFVSSCYSEGPVLQLSLTLNQI